tara:strand:- start:416 stop:910 length:495 start_codon:yes stop_codon:yes gene_type:complete
MKRSMNEITTDIMTQQMNMEMALNPEEFNVQIQELFTELYNKEDGIYWFYRDNEKKIEMINEHIDKCKNIKKMLSNSNERMKQLVIQSHEQTDSMPKHSVFNPLKIRKSSGAVEVIDESDIPNEYWVEVVTKKLDKKRILEELKKGSKIPGVRLVRKNFIGGFR